MQIILQRCLPITDFDTTCTTKLLTANDALLICSIPERWEKTTNLKKLVFTKGTLIQRIFCIDKGTKGKWELKGKWDLSLGSPLYIENCYQTLVYFSLTFRIKSLVWNC